MRIPDTLIAEFNQSNYDKDCHPWVFYNQPEGTFCCYYTKEVNISLEKFTDIMSDIKNYIEKKYNFYVLLESVLKKDRRLKFIFTLRNSNDIVD